MSVGLGVRVAGGGACTSIGSTLPASAAAVRAGVTAFGDHPSMVDSTGQPMIVSRADYLPDESAGVDRLLSLALSAALEASQALTSAEREPAPMPVIVGLPPPRPGVPGDIERTFAPQLSRLLGAELPVARVETIACGHSAGLMALARGCAAIEAGAADFYLIGGVDSYLEGETLEWLEDADQLNSAGVENNAWGFIPGEAAGFCLLASTRAAEGWGIYDHGEILAVSLTRERSLIKTDSVCLGHGLTSAFEGAFRNLRAPNAKIDEIICDMNGEPYRAEEFGFATIRTDHYFVNAAEFQTPADCWGDVGAASGPLFVNLSVTAHSKGYAQGATTLIWTSSESGERAATVLAFPTGAERR